MLKGKDGIVYVDNPKERLGSVQNWNIDEQADTVAGWGMGDTSETAFTTISRFTGSAEVYLDFADASDDVSVGDVLPLELYPGGETTGSGYFSGTILVTGISRSGAKDGIPSATINFRNSSGVLSKGTVA
ncbi:hypothetical protein [Falsiruegeria litorea]|uniref:hypothetical protein n=1 Tax=Falsiruegeria litorea TaxID=1280831 RepID=UPI001BFD0270|nr:hypothetical protein [Falsiruegeria litorea]MBT8169875.1 hypothetical protein [Falsiruegeria litorea]